MDVFHILLDRIDWELELFTNVECEDIGKMVEQSNVLRENSSVCGKIFRKLSNCGYNTGFACTDTSMGKSVIVIGKTTSVKEFFNTLFHEVSHLTVHMFHISGMHKEEEFCYLNGYLGSCVSDCLYNYYK